MNYAGRVLGQQFSGDFLKEALRKADMKKFIVTMKRYMNVIFMED